MKIWHFLGIIVIFLVIGGWFILKGPTHQPSNSPTSTSIATVLMKADSFDPAEITIKKGTTVEFKNVDTQPHWPASDIHPTHTIYPEFDPQKPIDTGQSYLFTFQKVGNWKDHDHLIPSIRGTVVVTE